MRFDYLADLSNVPRLGGLFNVYMMGYVNTMRCPASEVYRSVRREYQGPNGSLYGTSSARHCAVIDKEGFEPHRRARLILTEPLHRNDFVKEKGGVCIGGEL